MEKFFGGKKRFLRTVGFFLAFCLVLGGCSKVADEQTDATVSGSVTLTPTPEGTKTPTPTPAEESLPPIYEVQPVKNTVLGTRLCEHYQGMFRVGVCVNSMTLQNPDACDLVIEQYNSITCENEMKPDALLDQTASRIIGEVVVTFPKRTLKIMDWAQENGLKMRGHVLVWHAQTPEWFFREGFQNSGALVSADEMKLRMESYIRQVLEFCNSHYPGLIYAWDVVNEAFNDGSGTIRDCNWTKILGEDYIRLGFEYARKYADENTLLFYNDFNCYESSKRMGIINKVKELKELELIDGVGMQSHVKTDYPSMEAYLRTLEQFSKLGVEVQITELDVGCSAGDAGLLTQANYYELLFKMISAYEKNGTSNLTSVTFWGVSDSMSWRSEDRPLLFDRFLNPKDAYYRVLQEERP